MCPPTPHDADTGSHPSSRLRRWIVRLLTKASEAYIPEILGVTVSLFGTVFSWSGFGQGLYFDAVNVMSLGSIKATYIVVHNPSWRDADPATITCRFRADNVGNVRPKGAHIQVTSDSSIQPADSLQVLIELSRGMTLKDMRSCEQGIVELVASCDGDVPAGEYRAVTIAGIKCTKENTYGRIDGEICACHGDKEGGVKLDKGRFPVAVIGTLLQLGAWASLLVLILFLVLWLRSRRRHGGLTPVGSQVGNPSS